jgi:hypothetical protein
MNQRPISLIMILKVTIARENGETTEYPMLETFLFAIDVQEKELFMLYVPRDGCNKPWTIISRKTVERDTR